MTTEVRPDETPTVTVVICAYTLDRWTLLQQSMSSVLNQTVLPCEVILCIDHNRELFTQCISALPASGSGLPITVVENAYAGRLGSARTTALELAQCVGRRHVDCSIIAGILRITRSCCDRGGADPRVRRPMSRMVSTGLLLGFWLPLSRAARSQDAR
jgi:hypothetical protein